MSFSFAHHWHIYLFFSLGILLLTWLDLKQEKKNSKPLLWSFIWISLGLLVGLGMYEYSLFYAEKQHEHATALLIAKQHAVEYYAGYIVEKTLAIDNIFVFLLIFSSLNISPSKQQRILFLGVLGAIIFRALFIALGAILLSFSWITWFFGALIFLTGLKLLFSHENPQIANPLIHKLSHYLPFDSQNRGSNFFVKSSKGWKVTAIFIALLAIEISDIIFALDSVPAIFALTNEPLIIFTSNISAVMGLRSMYFLLAEFVTKFHLLRYGLSATLLFIGLKMCWLNPMYEGHFPITWSLFIICLCLGSSILASLIIPKTHENPIQ